MLKGIDPLLNADGAPIDAYLASVSIRDDRTVLDMVAYASDEALDNDALIAERYQGIATRVVNYFGAIAWTEDPQHLSRWKPIAESLAAIP